MVIRDDHYIGKIVIDDKELRDTLERLHKVTEEIRDCYNALQNMGFIEFKKILAADDGEDGQSRS